MTMENDKSDTIYTSSLKVNIKHKPLQVISRDFFLQNLVYLVIVFKYCTIRTNNLYMSSVHPPNFFL